MTETKQQESSKKNHLMKSSWNFGKTCTIRVPLALKRQVIKVARHLDNGGEIILSDKVVEINSNKKPESILSQDKVSEIIKTLKHGITSKKQGGVYNSSNASTLKREVIKVLKILES